MEAKYANAWAESSLIYPVAEVAENGEFAQPPIFDWGENSSNSSNSATGYVQRAVFPEDSILKAYFGYAREQEEGADCFLIGSILPVCAALLARRVFLKWGDKKKYPNLWTMLAGKPGDRKSSAIDFAELVARETLPNEAFIPKAFSPETLFDEYDENSGGRPDKLWLVDDANPTLKDWQKTQNGERIATRFLQLHDCCSLSESFRRNKNGEKGKPRRTIPETSTSLCFGATFNICRFQGQDLRGGLARRFLYYVATGHGRFIARPKGTRLNEIIPLFERLKTFEGEIDFTPEAAVWWENYQRANRDDMARTDQMDEAALSRLNSAPMQVLSIAIVFEACRAAYKQRTLSNITPDSLELAISHVEGCLEAASELETIAERATLSADADVFLAKIRRDYSDQAKDGSIVLTRTDLTSRFCHNGLRGGTRPDDLYNKWIPCLSRKNQARLLVKDGKKELYAFRVEE
jgi:hypothetical protein